MKEPASFQTLEQSAQSSSPRPQPLRPSMPADTQHRGVQHNHLIYTLFIYGAVHTLFVLLPRSPWQIGQESRKQSSRSERWHRGTWGRKQSS